VAKALSRVYKYMFNCLTSLNVIKTTNQVQLHRTFSEQAETK